MSPARRSVADDLNPFSSLIRNALASGRICPVRFKGRRLKTRVSVTVFMAKPYANYEFRCKIFHMVDKYVNAGTFLAENCTP